MLNWTALGFDFNEAELRPTADANLNSSNALRIWYQQPANEWNEALPIGNGRLAAMVFGGIESERLCGE